MHMLFFQRKVGVLLGYSMRRGSELNVSIATMRACAPLSDLGTRLSDPPWIRRSFPKAVTATIRH